MANLTVYGATRAMSGADVAPTTLYVALGTGQSAAGLIGEPSSGGYGRVAAGTFTKSANAAANAAQITFAGFTAALGNHTHWALYDAATNGNCVWVGALNSTVNIMAGGQVVFQSGDLRLSFPTAA